MFFPESPFQQKRIRCKQNTDSVHVPRQWSRALLHGDENQRRVFESVINRHRAFRHFEGLHGIAVSGVLFLFFMVESPHFYWMECNSVRLPSWNHISALSLTQERRRWDTGHVCLPGVRTMKGQESCDARAGGWVPCCPSPARGMWGGLASRGPWAAQKGFPVAARIP